MTPDAQPDPANQPIAKSRAKWQWHRFSLRAMFVWMTVIGVLLALGLRWIAPAQRQRAAVQMVERLGGYVVYSEARADEAWLVAQLRECWPRYYFDPIVAVGLSGTPVTDSDLSLLRSMTDLKWLYLGNTQVTDAGANRLGDALPSCRIYFGNRCGLEQ